MGKKFKNLFSFSLKTKIQKEEIMIAVFELLYLSLNMIIIHAKLYKKAGNDVVLYLKIFKLKKVFEKIKQKFNY